MKYQSVGFAMTILIIGNLIAVFSDTFVKSVGSNGAVFQFVFFRQVAAVLLLLPFCYRSNWQGLTAGFKWHIIRGHIWLIGSIGMFIALNTLPLATANAIFYSAPLLMLPMAVLMYKEKLNRYSILAGVLGFTGVIVIIRPTEISLPAIAGLIVALSLALNNLLVKKLPTKQKLADSLLMTNITCLPVSFVLVLLENKPWHLDYIYPASGSSITILLYTCCGIIAYRSVESNKIASAEYSGLLGAVMVGILWFNEIPDIFMLIGTLLIVIPMILVANREKKPLKPNLL
ncbi:TPA: DMT family transporter [Photobacterium damselae]